MNQRRPPYFIQAIVWCLWVLSITNVGATRSWGQSPKPMSAFPAADSVDRPLLKQLGSSFHDFASSHFMILSDSHATEVARLVQIAEETLVDVASFARHLEIPIRRPSAKLMVIFFNDWPTYRQFAGQAGLDVSEAAPGFYNDHTNRCLIFNYANSQALRRIQRSLLQTQQQSTKTGEDHSSEEAHPRTVVKQIQLEKINRHLRAYEQLIIHTVIRHEIAHQVLTNLGLLPRPIGQSRWLPEGLAMQFETRDLVNHYRLADFPVLDRKEGLSALRELVGNPAYIGPGGENLSGRYAEAWALVAYLVHRRPKALASFLISQCRGVRPTNRLPSTLSTFEAAFGPLDASFSQKFQAYMSNLKSDR